MPLPNEEEVNIVVSQRLREARLARGLSQAKVAEALGVSRQAIYNYEKGHHVITPGNLFKLAEFFGRPIEWFYGIEGKETIQVGSQEPEDLDKFLEGLPANHLVKALAKQLGIPEKAAWSVYLGLQAAKAAAGAPTGSGGT